MDPSQPSEFSQHPSWQRLDETLSIFQIDPDTDAVKGFSFSGSERNRMFLRRGENFRDVSLISNLDFKEDGRGFVLFDFDKDGDLDLGVCSNQSPRFRIVENVLANSAEDNYVNLRLEGANSTSNPDLRFSSRDPVGARVIVKTGKSRRMFQLGCGEGFSAQNSRTIHIGMGKSTKIDELEIHWPNGRVTLEKNVTANSNLKLRESSAP